MPHQQLLYTENYEFSSDPASGSLNLSADGSTFDVQLNNPIEIPHNAKSVRLAVYNATIWNNAFNISADIENNQFTYIVGGVSKTATIPDGQYSVSALQSAISRILSDNGDDIEGIILIADTATSKLILSLKATYQVDYTAIDSPYLIMGFNQGDVVPAAPPVADVLEYAPNVAQFNRVNLYRIKSDLISAGIPVNQNYNSIIASVPIDVQPSSQIVYNPRNPTEVNAQELAGYKKYNIKFELLDQQNRRVDTNGEYWTVLIRFSYYL
jgi:hypothetical protein